MSQAKQKAVSMELLPTEGYVLICCVTMARPHPTQSMVNVTGTSKVHYNKEHYDITG